MARGGLWLRVHLCLFDRLFTLFLFGSVTFPIAAHNSDLRLRRRGPSVYEGIDE